MLGRSRSLLLLWALSLLLAANSADAALLWVSADQPVVSVGDTIHLSVEGRINPSFEPGALVEVWLPLPASTTLLGFSADTGEQLAFGNSLFTWNVGPLQGSVVAGELGVFSQTAPPGSSGITNYCRGNGFCASLMANIQLRADAPGVLNFDFSTVDFFGATAGLGTQVTVVPEPSTSALLGMGLSAVALWRRRRAPKIRNGPGTRRTEGGPTALDRPG